MAEKRAAVYMATADPLLVRNQRAALARYACAAGWSIVVDVSSDARRARELAASGAIDIVLTWQLHDSPDETDVVAACRMNNVEFLALAQSCPALAE
jgi:dihydropteroate synthase